MGRCGAGTRVRRLISTPRSRRSKEKSQRRTLAPAHSGTYALAFERILDECDPAVETLDWLEERLEAAEQEVSGAGSEADRIPVDSAVLRGVLDEIGE
jgi:hypothetical protein